MFQEHNRLPPVCFHCCPLPRPESVQVCPSNRNKTQTILQRERTRGTKMDVSEMAFIALEWTHQMIPVPSLIMSRGVLIDQILRIHNGVIQVLRLEDRKLVRWVFVVARMVPSPITNRYSGGPPVSIICAEYPLQLSNLYSTLVAACFVP